MDIFCLDFFILKSSFACSQDEARPLLKGCLLEIEDGFISSVALDGFRLAIYRKKIIGKYNVQFPLPPELSAVHMEHFGFFHNQMELTP